MTIQNITLQQTNSIEKPKEETKYQKVTAIVSTVALAAFASLAITLGVFAFGASAFLGTLSLAATALGFSFGGYVVYKTIKTARNTLPPTKKPVEI